MEILINQFMHTYFWVFLILVSLDILSSDEDVIEVAKKSNLSFWTIFGWTLFILSFKY